MKKTGKPTMRDVARLAGVSTTTVSAVVNGAPPVCPPRKQRVLEAMSALHYRPDALARSLKTGQTRAIGVVVPDMTNGFYPEVIRGVGDAAHSAGYTVFVCDSNEDPATEENHLNALFSRRVDGILLAYCANSTAYQNLLPRHFPIVFVDRVPPSAGGGSVTSDNVQAGYSATRHLLDLGHERIAMIAGNLALSPQRERLEGFRKAMQEANLPIRGEYLICGDANLHSHMTAQIEYGLKSSRRLLDLDLQPTAIMAGDNRLLLGALRGLEERKILVPKEISILGFEDRLWNRYVHPRLTTVAQATYEIGKRAFHLLLNIMNNEEGKETCDRHIRLSAELRVRDSTTSPAA